MADRLRPYRCVLPSFDANSKSFLADERDVLMDYKDTVNLPKTSFPMKANLGKLEQELLRR